MIDVLKELIKQPYWAISLILGVVLISFPCVTIDKDYHWMSHPPKTLWPVFVGLPLLLVSAAGFLLSFREKRAGKEEDIGRGLDLTRVKERDGALWTSVNGCEIHVRQGQIQNCAFDSGTAIVLPCNEYFDDLCVRDSRSALGAYAEKVFEGQVDEFSSLIIEEAAQQLGPGAEYKKTVKVTARSFGPGKCVLLLKPLNRSVPIALVSTTTQRADEGLLARISYLFDGMRELVKRLADARITEVTMPVLGSGHGRIDPPLALVGLLLAVAEVARYGKGGQRLRKVTIIVFKPEGDTPAAVDPFVVRRALALVGTTP
jgi:Domain of unknown function (DUF6430)